MSNKADDHLCVLGQQQLTPGLSSSMLSQPILDDMES